MSVQFKYVAFSDVGLVRKSNQDAGYASTNLLVLADGMGGAAGGDIASSVTIAHLATIDDTHQADDLLPLLRRTLAEAHEELIERAREKKELAGLGTTCIAVLRTSNKLAMVHIGDSRAYLLRDGKLTQVTRDHTLVQYLVDHGELTPEEAAHHPKRNVIMRNIGDSPEPLELDESIREAVVGDRWLLCSDGLFGVVSNETIAEVLSAPEIADAGAKLIDLALAAGAPDNVTVVIAEVLPSSGQSYDRGPVVVGSAAAKRKPSRLGRGAAGRAAALTKREELADDVEEQAPPRRRWVARLSASLGIIALVITGALAGYKWTQSQYFVAEHNGKVAIYQGIPQHLGPIDFSSLKMDTELSMSDLSEVARQRLLESPITRSSLPDALQAVKDLEKQKVAPSPAPSSTPSPAGTPASPSSSPSASLTPTTNGGGE
ncbi:protein phosphatase [Arcanobacterium wilhelmae]|uniref:Protein phosphatase n=1 Tax=Arcanobacterium wilhelmae TaxID=1803177 RepID=A0ABT9NB58_9ACTO|nr:protein phosphatase 2C domain-containing protein [Arcanobacterium wilhelmae]MDP9800954.1 protein phosphatase [Arcanobacterium wilhelmae]WFN90314.1 protein phosphatase 2C domain-containing protein [Arcanobacterium wilhelmae]